MWLLGANVNERQGIDYLMERSICPLGVYLGNRKERWIGTNVFVTRFPGRGRRQARVFSSLFCRFVYTSFLFHPLLFSRLWDELRLKPVDMDHWCLSERFPSVLFVAWRKSLPLDHINFTMTLFLGLCVDHGFDKTQKRYHYHRFHSTFRLNPAHCTVWSHQMIGSANSRAPTRTCHRKIPTATSMNVARR